MAERVECHVLVEVFVDAEAQELPAFGRLFFLEVVQRRVAGLVSALGARAVSNRVAFVHPQEDRHTVAVYADRRAWGWSHAWVRTFAVAEGVERHVLVKVVVRAQTEELPALVGLLFLEPVERRVAGYVRALGSGVALNRVAGLHPSFDRVTVAWYADRSLSGG